MRGSGGGSAAKTVMASARKGASSGSHSRRIRVFRDQRVFQMQSPCLPWKKGKTAAHAAPFGVFSLP
jgi:hypothetical protein